MPRNLLVWLTDILEAIGEIRKTVENIDFDTYKMNWQKRRAVERGLEIISESSRHISNELKVFAPEVPWERIAGIGNILRHEYHRVDDQAVWNIVQKHLPRLAAGTAKIISHLDEKK